jgi:hypothetical protein
MIDIFQIQAERTFVDRDGIEFLLQYSTYEYRYRENALLYAKELIDNIKIHSENVIVSNIDNNTFILTNFKEKELKVVIRIIFKQFQDND